MKIKRFSATGGFCPETGCVVYDEESGKWRIINNKKGGYLKAKFDSEEKAKNFLKAMHARH